MIFPEIDKNSKNPVEQFRIIMRGLGYSEWEISVDITNKVDVIRSRRRHALREQLDEILEKMTDAELVALEGGEQ